MLRYSDTLLYYDGVQLFSAADGGGQDYVCLLVECDIAKDKYLCVPISPAQLGELCQGELDVRQAFSIVKRNGAFIVETGDVPARLFPIRPIGAEEVPEWWLPDSGLFLDAGPQWSGA